MFEWIASGLARFTTRRPWLAIIAVLAVAIGLSAMGRPEMSNDSSEFAPEDPAITASERIEALFGEESAVQPLQVVLVAESGDIVGTDGLAAATTVVETLQSVEIDGVRLTDFLVEQPGTGSITSFMSPVELAVANGAPAPTTDAEVKALLESGLAFAPPAQAELLNGLFEGGLEDGHHGPRGPDAGLLRDARGHRQLRAAVPAAGRVRHGAPVGRLQRRRGPPVLRLSHLPVRRRLRHRDPPPPLQRHRHHRPRAALRLLDRRPTASLPARPPHRRRYDPRAAGRDVRDHHHRRHGRHPGPRWPGPHRQRVGPQLHRLHPARRPRRRLRHPPQLGLPQGPRSRARPWRRP